MRIVAGRNRGRGLDVPPGNAVRPTADRAREALFDILDGGRVFPDFDLTDARVLDVFAGSGAVGLEALSRGAARAVFIENGREALSSLRRNIAALGETGRTRVLAADARHLGAAPEVFDFVFLDPPYGVGLLGPTLTALTAGGWLAPGAAVVAELAAKEPFVPPEGFQVRDERRYGAGRFVFLMRGALAS
ncbi:MAG: 16S rRNA (guanine(966)-N(2))-methyltransferase RsmD [Rhodospirillaceae bacterium]|nr:16S rRNA (guanine(966)-N(2))-methyltransferase RsmD [Rhodospirillaceae bacterium]